MTERMDCPIVARFTDEFCHDAELVAIGADWLAHLAGDEERAQLAAKALSVVAHRLRCFHRDFLCWRRRPPCSWTLREKCLRALSRSMCRMRRRWRRKPPVEGEAAKVAGAWLSVLRVARGEGRAR